jgi:hypothetical protein
MNCRRFRYTASGVISDDRILGECHLFISVCPLIH